MRQQSSRTSMRQGPDCHWGRKMGYATGNSGWGGDDPATSPGPGARAWTFPDAPDVRVSDHDRSAVVEQLTRHFQAGRLDMNEFEERTGQALGARTRRDLSGLLTDLPPVGPSYRTRQPRYGRPRLPMVMAVVPVLLVIFLAGLVVSGARHGFDFPWFLVPVAVFVALRLRRRRWHPLSRR